MKIKTIERCVVGMMVTIPTAILIALVLLLTEPADKPVFSGYAHDAEYLPQVHSGDYLEYYHIDTDSYQRVRIP